MTELQQTMTKGQLMKLCKLLHPTLTNESLEKLKFGRQYTWVSVDFKAQGKTISFGIDNHHNTTLWGPNVSIEQIKMALKNKQIKGKVWRFSLDSDFKTVNADAMQNIGVIDWIKHNVKPPTATEFYKEYYKD